MSNFSGTGNIHMGCKFTYYFSENVSVLVRCIQFRVKVCGYNSSVKLENPFHML